MTRLTIRRDLQRIVALILTLVLACTMVLASGEMLGNGIAYAASKPARVTGLKAAKKDSTSIKLTWTKVTGASKYEVYDAYYDDKDGLVWEKKATVTKNTYTTSQAQAWKYYYKVRAVNDEGNGAYSRAVDIKLAVTNYVKCKNVPSYSALYNTSSKYSGTAGNGYYYDYTKTGFMEDYIVYLIDNGWKEYETGSDYARLKKTINKKVVKVYVGITSAGLLMIDVYK